MQATSTTLTKKKGKITKLDTFGLQMLFDGIILGIFDGY